MQTENKNTAIEKIDDSQFRELAGKVFLNIENALEEAFEKQDLDVDVERQGSSVLNIKFPNHTVIVVNMQTPLHELWVAAKEGGFHYRWSGTLAKPMWLDTKTQEELYEALSRFVTKQGGIALHISQA
jgi:CyaY protein